ncbi:hypothetical protein [Paraliomyxa miuraensis]|uniref:hypothetical protein n=1 Tax=Paraliomyxa miuraensis TaxID=376150 RepID=UPI00225A2D46|nr:hypothetical protein [Paraliomyxa miuraensis]MCX4239880.1 hypothetical protein [Paraliomyxa miuraensis]
MAFEHVPLSETELGPAVWKVVRPEAPAPLQGMVARGLAPLPPRDLVTALYQLWAANVPELAEQAARTVVGLPPKILTGALSDPTLPSGALDFVGRKLPREVAMLEAIVGHPNVHDQTLVGLARLCPEAICDILAENQDRWLRCPAIVESLYQNPNCRMSVAQRMLELAVREGLELRLPNFEEIKQAIFASGEEASEAEDVDDEQFRQMVHRVLEGQEQLVERMAQAAAGEELDPNAVVAEAAEGGDGDGDDGVLAALEQALDGGVHDELDLPLLADEVERAQQPAAREQGADLKGDRVSQISKLSMMKKIRLAILGNAFERAVLIRDSNKAVALSAIKSPRVKENEVVAYCANRSLGHDVIRYIATRREWTKLYAVKINLVLNPKTPMAAAMSLLNHLHAHDVRKVAHSRNIPSALATAAKRRLAQRR